MLNAPVSGCECDANQYGYRIGINCVFILCYGIDMFFLKKIKIKLNTQEYTYNATVHAVAIFLFLIPWNKLNSMAFYVRTYYIKYYVNCVFRINGDFLFVCSRCHIVCV